MKTKLLKLYKNGKNFQTVTFQKQDNITGWQAVHFDSDSYLPFALYHSLDVMKERLIEQNIQFKWTDL